jgi:hypothetical protein
LLGASEFVVGGGFESSLLVGVVGLVVALRLRGLNLVVRLRLLVLRLLVARLLVLRFLVARLLVARLLVVRHLVLGLVVALRLRELDLVERLLVGRLVIVRRREMGSVKGRKLRIVEQSVEAGEVIVVGVAIGDVRQLVVEGVGDILAHLGSLQIGEGVLVLIGEDRVAEAAVVGQLHGVVVHGIIHSDLNLVIVHHCLRVGERAAVLAEDDTLAQDGVPAILEAIQVQLVHSWAVVLRVRVSVATLRLSSRVLLHSCLSVTLLTVLSVLTVLAGGLSILTVLTLLTAVG